jgi:hypothetical protein
MVIPAYISQNDGVHKDMTQKTFIKTAKICTSHYVYVLIYHVQRRVYYYNKLYFKNILAPMGVLAHENIMHMVKNQLQQR